MFYTIDEVLTTKLGLSPFLVFLTYFFTILVFVLLILAIVYLVMLIFKKDESLPCQEQEEEKEEDKGSLKDKIKGIALNVGTFFKTTFTKIKEFFCSLFKKD